MVSYFNNCLVLICRAKKCRVLIRFRFLNNIPSFLLNMNLYIICVFLFIFSYFKGLKRGVFGRIYANGFAVRIMKVQTTIFNKFFFLSGSPCTLKVCFLSQEFSFSVDSSPVNIVLHVLTHLTKIRPVLNFQGNFTSFFQLKTKIVTSICQIHKQNHSTQYTFFSFSYNLHPNLNTPFVKLPLFQIKYMRKNFRHI